MNKFKEDLKVNNKKDVSFEEKLRLGVIDGLSKVEFDTPEEDMKRSEMIININSIINHYDEVKPLLINFFKEKEDNEKWIEN